MLFIDYPNWRNRYDACRRLRPRAVPREKGGTADNTSKKEIRPLFALVKLAPPLHKHYLYPNNYYVSDLIDRRIDFDKWEYCVVWATRISFPEAFSI